MTDIKTICMTGLADKTELWSSNSTHSPDAGANNTATINWYQGVKLGDRDNIMGAILKERSLVALGLILMLVLFHC